MPHIPVEMHQDHGSEPAICLRSIQSGFSSVMMDGSLEADITVNTQHITCWFCGKFICTV
jgi:fructose/tagatose bisphosphate aldolase